MITLKEARKLTVEVVAKTDAAKIVDKYVRRAIEDGKVRCVIPKSEYSGIVEREQFLLAIQDFGFRCWPIIETECVYPTIRERDTGDIAVEWGLTDKEQKSE